MGQWKFDIEIRWMDAMTIKHPFQTIFLWCTSKQTDGDARSYILRLSIRSPHDRKQFIKLDQRLLAPHPVCVDLRIK